MTSAERELIKGLGALLPVGSRDEAPDRGVRGQSPLKLTTSLHDYICEVILTLVAQLCCIRE